MRASFIRVLVLLICAAAIVPLSGPLSMMAQEDEDEEGMVYCYCYFEEGTESLLPPKHDVSMELEFPAAGGQVRGSYRSIFVGGHMSRLYDEDGSSQDYMEERTVSVNMQFDGFYTGGDTGVFSLEATGTARVDIDNSVDDRFDRSYQAELTNPAFDVAATAEGVRNPDGSVTISGMSGQFVPVSIDANEISNTEWVEPSAETVSPNLTLTCTTQEEAETPPEMSCAITTTPDQIGPQDTAFQASGTASGFAGDTTWKWTLGGPGKYEEYEGQNTTIYWGGTTYPPGFYDLYAQVTDGQYVAQCHKYFSIGDVEPNNPPQCLNVRILPSSPAAGATSLRAEVDAFDPDNGDSLDYYFYLLEGTVRIGASDFPLGVVPPPSYTFSIPGGLQPGPHTLLAYVFDGEYSVTCHHHFTIPGAGPTITQPPTVLPSGTPSVGPVPTQVTIAQPPPTQPVTITQPPQTSCSITTVPDPLGPGDTTFQARVVPTGFAAGRTLTFDWILTDRNKWEYPAGQNPTISWPDPSFAPGFYTLSALVTDGEYVARCARHWSIGGGQNQPPQCVSVDINPIAPSAGATSLGASVQALDPDPGDTLSYTFALKQGTSSPATLGMAAGPRHTFSVPGGLQPGGYTVEVLVDDGKHTVACSRNLAVAGAAAPPGPAQPPAAVPVGAPTGPPKPPQPPAVAPQPPAPPPVPPATEGCGLVQVIYLDDLGVGMNQTEIDAFVENTLALGGPDLSLIVSHRQALVDRFGQQGFEQINGLLNGLGGIAETCPFVLIVGDADVVPFGIVSNPTDDGDVLLTDDVYGDNDHDDLGTPDIPVARIPDGHSLDLLVTQLSPSSVPEGGDFTLANSKRPHADGVASQVFGADRILMWSLPTQHEQVGVSQVDVRHSYYMLHGASWDTTVWWGEEETYPEAFTVAEASTQGIVLSGACYGGYTFGRTPENSITLSFLHSGARAFVGSTGITYSPLWTGGPNPTGPMRHDAVFHEAFLSAVDRGEAPLAAFVEAKQEMADLCRLGDSTPAELKMLHEFIYFGKP
jgi:hypothetical protein